MESEIRASKTARGMTGLRGRAMEKELPISRAEEREALEKVKMGQASGIDGVCEKRVKQRRVLSATPCSTMELPIEGYTIAGGFPDFSTITCLFMSLSSPSLPNLSSP